MSEEDIYLDNIEDRRFFPRKANLRTATGGHLGNSPEQKIQTANALGLVHLASLVEMEWSEGDERDLNHWERRFKLICQLLSHIRGVGQTKEESIVDIEPMMEWRLRRVEWLHLKVSIEGAPAEDVPVHARLHKGDLTVAGQPVQFGADAAKALLRAFSFGQRADLSADLTAMLTAIGEDSDFALALDKFKRSFARGFDLPYRVQAMVDTEDVEKKHKAKPTWAKTENTPINEAGTADVHTDESVNVVAPVGPYNRERALARSRAAVDQTLMGELREDSNDSDEGEKSGIDSTPFRTDEVYRKVAAQYERENDRKPEIGDPNQVGWDVRSVDPKTGSIRLIEVKGKGRPWTEDEAVDLSRAQVHTAFKSENSDIWYLYVVERTEDSTYRVLPIRNPIQRAGKWIVCGGIWRRVAEEPQTVIYEPTDLV